MRRNFAQILKDAKIDIKVEYQKLYGMLYDRSIQVSNTNRISVYDELSTYFIAFHFRGTCLSLDEFNDLHGFHFEKDPTNFNIDHLISLCEYIENLLIAYQCVSLSYPYEYTALEISIGIKDILPDNKRKRGSNYGKSEHREEKHQADPVDH